VSFINRQPAGLLGFLGIKNFGRNPDVLASTLAPTWDVASLYLNDAAQYQMVTDGALAAGNHLVVTPPQNQVWYVTDYGAFFEAGAGAALICNLARFGQVNTDYVPIAATVGLGASSGTVSIAQGPIIVGRGEKLGFTVHGVVGIATAVIGCRYVVLDV